ncbi:MAG: prephenate dehydrogenase/arogenate dehydrogenase family protein, partial [Anaerolineales bacterium]|nr:prephenate dehydrogenase/arogenate dehydrogenase family protein [Anaerolineales bacterium]
MTTEILFIGLQEQGASLAMALAQASVDTMHVGYDRNREASRAAQEAEAVEKVVIDPFKAAETADLVIISLSSDEAEAMLKDIEPRLKPDSVVLDCSHLSASTLRWATDNLGPDRHYLGAMPVIRPEMLHEIQADYRDAHANMYEDSLLALVVPTETPEPAVNMALNIAEAIGSSPFFVDPAEMEAVTTLIETLPTLLGRAARDVNQDRRFRRRQIDPHSPLTAGDDGDAFA